MEQGTLASAFNVFGIPKINRKDTFEAFNSICTALDCAVTEADLKELYVVHHKNNLTSHLSGSFYDVRKKIEIMNAQKAARKAEKPIICEDVFPTLELNHPLRGKEISLMARLTDTTSALYNFALSYWDVYKHIWETDGKILVKVTDKSKPIEILSRDHLIWLNGEPKHPDSRRPKKTRNYLATNISTPSLISSKANSPNMANAPDEQPVP